MGWMIYNHLQYVPRFRFKINSEQKVGQCYSQTSAQGKNPMSYARFPVLLEIFAHREKLRQEWQDGSLKKEQFFSFFPDTLSYIHITIFAVSLLCSGETPSVLCTHTDPLPHPSTLSWLVEIGFKERLLTEEPMGGAWPSASPPWGPATPPN